MSEEEPGQNGEFNLDKLRQEQEAYEAELREVIEELQAQQAHKAKEKKWAKKAAEILERAKTAKSRLEIKLEELGAEEIERHIAERKEIENQKSALEEQLKEVEEKLGLIEERISSVHQIIHGKEEIEIAPKIREVLVKLESESRELGERKDYLRESLRSLEASLIPKERIAEYEKLKRALEKLTKGIEKIESHPLVKQEQLIKDITYMVINMATSVGTMFYQERKQYLEKLVRFFMEEEFENHLQNISDPKEQITKAEELAENIKEGLKAEKKTPYPDETDHGVLLRNLMGLYYVVYLPLSLSNVVLAEDPRKKTTLKEEELIAQGLRRYLKTFNFILGYARGLQSKILGSTENEKLGVNILSQLSINGLKDFTERAKNLGFKVTDEGLLFPKDAPFIEEGLKANFIEGEKMAEEVRRSYEREWITEKEEKLEEEKAKYQEELQKVREKLTNLRDVLPKLQEDESPTHKKEPILVYNLKREIEEKENLIRKLKDSLSYRRNELVRTSAVSFIKRRQLNQEIQDLEGKIASLEGELPSLRKRVKDLQTKIDEASQRKREYRSSSYVEEEIKRLENREKELEERIAGILREQENIASYKKELGE